MNIVTEGSQTEHFIQLRSKYFVDDVSQLDIAVLQPPNMGNKTQRHEFLRVLKRFEKANCSTGRSQFWFFAYQSYLKDMGFGDINDDHDLNYTVSFKLILKNFTMNFLKNSII